MSCLDDETDRLMEELHMNNFGNPPYVGPSTREIIKEMRKDDETIIFNIQMDNYDGVVSVILRKHKAEK